MNRKEMPSVSMAELVCAHGRKMEEQEKRGLHTEKWLPRTLEPSTAATHGQKFPFVPILG